MLLLPLSLSAAAPPPLAVILKLIVGFVRSADEGRQFRCTHRGRGLILFGPGCCASSSSWYFVDAGALPCLVIGFPACWRMSSSSCRLFLRRCTYLSSLPSCRSPRVGVYHCLGHPHCTIVSMGVRRPRHCHRPRRSAVGSPRRPSSAASTDVGVCARRHHCCRCCRPTPSPGCAPKGQRTVAAGVSANHRRQNQSCQLRAWNQRSSACRRPLCTWRRQGRSPKRREGQGNGISWPVIIIGLLDGGPGTELIIHQMGLNWEFYEGNMSSYEENEMRKGGAKIQFCVDFTLCAKPA